MKMNDTLTTAVPSFIGGGIAFIGKSIAVMTSTDFAAYAGGIAALFGMAYTAWKWFHEWREKRRKEKG